MVSWNCKYYLRPRKRASFQTFSYKCFLHYLNHFNSPPFPPPLSFCLMYHPFHRCVQLQSCPLRRVSVHAATFTKHLNKNFQTPGLTQMGWPALLLWTAPPPPQMGCNKNMQAAFWLCDAHMLMKFHLQPVLYFEHHHYQQRSQIHATDLKYIPLCTKSHSVEYVSIYIHFFLIIIYWFIDFFFSVYLFVSLR